MPVIYRDLADCLNKTEVKCHVYDGFLERIPLYFRRYPERRPLFTNGGGTDSYANLSISKMIELHSRNEPFTIHRAEDVIIVVNLIKAYLKQMKRFEDDLQPGDELALYIAKCKSLLHEIERHSKKVNAVVKEKTGISQRTERDIGDVIGILMG